MRILKCIRGILPCRFAVYPTATPPSQPAKRVGIYASQLCMGAQSGRTKKREAFTGAPVRMPLMREPRACFPKIRKFASVSDVPHFLCASRRRRHRGLPSARA
jgi:hypothetical protein